MSPAVRRSRAVARAAATFVALVLGVGVAAAAVPAAATTLDYLAEPLPAGVQVVPTERDGFVFADAAGHTLYTWPRGGPRGGIALAGEFPGRPACNDVRITVTRGFRIPYPAGLRVPNAAQRPTCTQVWPPLYAAADATPVGAWSVVPRTDGRRQWAYRGQPVYTSALDRQPGDTLGASRTLPGGDTLSRGGRGPIGPAANVPPGFRVRYDTDGVLLTTDNGSLVYVADRAGAAPCDAACLQSWKPMLAPALAQSRGRFTVLELAHGARQWAFAGQPLFVRVSRGVAYDWRDTGDDAPGWRIVYVQKAPAPPRDFKWQETSGGVVLADAAGKPVYFYLCTEDTEDELNCDTPEDLQDYRLAICGNGDAARCALQFPYVRAAPTATSASRLWSVMWIDPATGRRATAGQAGALSVWAFRQRPVYTYRGDVLPGEDPLAHHFGEETGHDNGYHAFYLRSPFISVIE